MKRSAKTEFQLLPYEQVGPIVFGMQRKAARKTLKSKVEAFDEAGLKQDRCAELGLTLQYSDNDTVLQASVYRTESGTTIVYSGVAVRPGQLLSAAVEELSAFDSALVTPEGVLFRGIGLGLYVTDDPEDELTEVVAITVFGPGTYPPSAE